MRRQKLTIFLTAALLGLSGCAGGSQQEDELSENQKGFIEGLGSRMTESTDGYYVVMGDYLTYLDKNLENPTIVCNKPNCLHNEEESSNRINCDAFFGAAIDLKYYREKLYIAANALDEVGDIAIYEVSLDGSEKRKLYTTDSETSAMTMTFYKDDMIVYAPYYDSDHENKVLSIVRFPMDDPGKAEVIFENSEYESADVNRLLCDGDTLYFWLIDFSNKITTYAFELDLKTNEANIFNEEINSGYHIGKDCIIGTCITESDSQTGYWKGDMNLYDKNGKKIGNITEEEFPPLAEGATIQTVDDENIYFIDAHYGDYMKPEEEQYLSVYTFDGEFMGKTPLKGLTMAYLPVPGSEDYMIIYDSVETESGREIVFYKVDKSQFGKADILEREEFLRYNVNDYSGFTY